MGQQGTGPESASSEGDGDTGADTTELLNYQAQVQATAPQATIFFRNENAEHVAIGKVFD
jgi:hypothetical protein